MKRLLALLALGFLFFTSCVENKVALTSRSNPKPEDVVYMSDIDGLVTAVMIYGMTNGIVYNGTNYIFVVEDMGPATSPGPVVPRETTFHFNGSPDETYLIEGALDTTKLAELGLYDENEMVWIKSLTSIEIGSGVTTIGNGTFYDCIGLTSVSIPNSVTSIGENAFDGCIDLTSVPIPDSVTTIGEGAFEYCTSLTSVTIPSSVTSIMANAFNGCSGLTSVTIPDSVTNIGVCAFASCSGLTSVTIPASVTSIGEVAFQSCERLTSVTMSGKTKATVQGMSDYSWELPSGCIIHCTDGDITVQ